MGDVITRKEIHQAVLVLVKMMLLEGSKKGEMYWQEVYKELERIAKTGEP